MILVLTILVLQYKPVLNKFIFFKNNYKIRKNKTQKFYWLKRNKLKVYLQEKDWKYHKFWANTIHSKINIAKIHSNKYICVILTWLTLNEGARLGAFNICIRLLIFHIYLFPVLVFVFCFLSSTSCLPCQVLLIFHYLKTQFQP